MRIFDFINNLTPKEFETVKMFQKGYSEIEIQKKLNISMHSFRLRQNSIFKKAQSAKITQKGQPWIIQKQDILRQLDVKVN